MPSDRTTTTKPLRSSQQLWGSAGIWREVTLVGGPGMLATQCNDDSTNTNTSMWVQAVVPTNNISVAAGGPKAALGVKRAHGEAMDMSGGSAGGGADFGAPSIVNRAPAFGLGQGTSGSGATTSMVPSAAASVMSGFNAYARVSSIAVGKGC